MTAAERQQRKRDRLKAGLVRVEFWVDEKYADDIKQSIAQRLHDYAARDLYRAQQDKLLAIVRETAPR